MHTPFLKRTFHYLHLQILTYTNYTRIGRVTCYLLTYMLCTYLNLHKLTNMSTYMPAYLHTYS